jgi:hypothetical protein
VTSATARKRDHRGKKSGKSAFASPLPSFGCTYVTNNSFWARPAASNFLLMLLIGLRAFLRLTPGQYGGFAAALKFLSPTVAGVTCESCTVPTRC